MKKIMMLVSCLLLVGGMSYAQGKKGGRSMPDGLYLIDRMDTTKALPAPLTKGEKALHFSRLFDEFNEDEVTRIVVNTTEYVPLELDKAPTTEQQTEAKKKLLLSLTPQASERLKSFTAKHVMHMVAIVVNGEVLTVHKIKEAITSGQLQISRCTDNACERLYVQLKDNIKK